VQKRLFRVLLYGLTLPFSCKAPVPVQPVPIEIAGPSKGEIPEMPVIRGTADEIRFLVETGSPASMAAALAMIQGRDLAGSEFGRLMNAAAATLFRSVYPDLPARYLPPDPPMTAVYTRILRDADQGIYTVPGPDSMDFLEYVLPFMAFYSGKNVSGEIRRALPHLERAARLNPVSVLPWLFRGFSYEKTGDAGAADAAYRAALERAEDCYPAELGLVRIMERAGETEEALSRLDVLAGRYPGNLAVKRELARSYAERGDWARSDTVVAEILASSPGDMEFLLLRARSALERRQYLDAQAALDVCASLDSGDRRYLFLRARLQAESYHNRDSALNYLRSILRSTPDDTGTLVYMAGLLMESSRSEDIDAGREILKRLLVPETPLPEVLSLAVKDAIRREAWQEARGFLERLLERRRERSDLLDAFAVERGLGNNTPALAYAQELFERDQTVEEAAEAYIIALADTGRRNEASRLIEQRLTAAAGARKSRYYYLRSRLRGGDEAAMNDLRSSLFEDPRNLDALVAMFEIYHRRRDERRAVYYLKQALALAPNNPMLKRREAEYREALGSGY
jgi:Tfp pilus assembly protein PilF